MNDRADMEITPAEAGRLLDERPDDVLLIDCRRDDEWAFARIDGAVHIPLDSIRLAAEDLAEDVGDREVIVYCHHGVRSLTAAAQLRAAGLDNARSMSGGIDQWSKDIDPSVPTY
jgi:rhodanese-related sulfurtransferase